MRKLFFLVLLVAGLSNIGHTQPYSNAGTITATAAQGACQTGYTTNGTNGACVGIQLPTASATTSITVSGTYSGTLRFEIARSGAIIQSVSCTPTGSTTSATSTTGTGIWQCSTSALGILTVRASAYSSGTANITLVSSVAP